MGLLATKFAGMVLIAAGMGAVICLIIFLLGALFNKFNSKETEK